VGSGILMFFAIGGLYGFALGETHVSDPGGSKLCLSVSAAVGNKTAYVGRAYWFFNLVQNFIKVALGQLAKFYLPAYAVAPCGVIEKILLLMS